MILPGSSVGFSRVLCLRGLTLSTSRLLLQKKTCSQVYIEVGIKKFVTIIRCLLVRFQGLRIFTLSGRL